MITYTIEFKWRYVWEYRAGIEFFRHKPGDIKRLVGINAFIWISEWSGQRPFFECWRSILEWNYTGSVSKWLRFIVLEAKMSVIGMMLNIQNPDQCLSASRVVHREWDPFSHWHIYTDNRGFEIIPPLNWERRRVMTICDGLATLNLPTLVLIMITDFEMSGLHFQDVLKLHQKWAIVKTIKDCYKHN